MSASTQAAPVPLPPSTSSTTSDAPTNSLENAPATSAAPTSTPEATSHPPSAEPITGLTPEQVLQELQKSGYVDELRRQMYDAFCSPPASAAAPAVASITSDGPSSVVPAGLAVVSNSIATAVPSSSGLAAPPLSSEAHAPLDPAAAASQLDIGTRPALLAFLAAPLRAHLERQHGTLRLAGMRDQTTTLMQLLESEPVDYPGRQQLGEATVYDLLLRHVVQASTGIEAGKGQGGTAGMLDRNGRFGNEAQARIRDTIAELMNPSAKVDDEDDDEDEEGEEGAQPEPTQRTTMDED